MGGNDVSKRGMMSSNIVGLVLIIFGVYQYLNNGNEPTDLIFWSKSLGCVVAGLFYVVYNNISKLSFHIPFSLPKFEKVVNTVTSSNKCFSPNEYNIKDTEALYHLKQRCIEANSKEGVETCCILADIIFKLDSPTYPKIDTVASEVKSVKKTR